MSSLSHYHTHFSFLPIHPLFGFVGWDSPSYSGILYDMVGEPHACTITLIYIPPALLFPLYNHSLIPPAENGMFIENGRPGGL